jgi:hypothetical protein
MEEYEQPGWDQVEADRLVGGVILIGITRRYPSGDEMEQLHGVIQSAAPSGITVRLSGPREGETYQLPPDLSAIEPAHPGEYRLRSTGEIVLDPDYIASWVITPPRT